MARRGHRKSRAGCIECKRRHLKCDETRPRCNKCIFSERECSWPDSQLSAIHVQNLSSSSNVGASSVQPPLPQLDRRTTDSNIQDDLNFLHLELLQTFQTQTYLIISTNQQHAQSYRDTLMSHAFSSRFLMYGILAFSALHLSLASEREVVIYREAATRLQAQAISKFHKVVPHIDASNAVPVLLLQHLIALHEFCDLFRCEAQNKGTTDLDFLDRLVGAIRLLRVMDTTVPAWWEVWTASRIGSMMLSSSDFQQTTTYISRGECQDLKDMLQEADLSLTSIAKCEEALNHLQHCFDRENDLSQQQETDLSINMIFAWPIKLTPDFVNLIEQRRPEALVLVAYYAVLLHRRRASWAIGSAGLSLLENIKRLLGNKWSQRLAWANDMIHSNV